MSLAALIILLTALVKKLTDVMKMVLGPVLAHSVITQVVAWVLGVLVTFGAAKTPAGAVALFAHTSLHSLSLGAQALLGLALGSLASLVHDAIVKYSARRDART